MQRPSELSALLCTSRPAAMYLHSLVNLSWIGLRRRVACQPARHACALGQVQELRLTVAHLQMFHAIVIAVLAYVGLRWRWNQTSARVGILGLGETSGLSRAHEASIGENPVDSGGEIHLQWQCHHRRGVREGIAFLACIIGGMWRLMVNHSTKMAYFKSPHHPVGRLCCAVNGCSRSTAACRQKSWISTA